MHVDRKDATIEASAKDEFPGTFVVRLSAQTKDRDGETLTRDTWKSLPDHITFDSDHGMSVATTVGSGAPYFDANGDLLVKGTFSSLPRAQEVRTLVTEGHINKTSVAFQRFKDVKDGKAVETRELLNGAFVAIPSNREADVLLAKSFDAALKLGSRNNDVDARHIQAIHDHAAALGASHGDPDPDEDTDAADEDPEKDSDKAKAKAKPKDAEKAYADFIALPTDVRLQVLKRLASVDDDADDTDPAAAVKAAAAEVPDADDIATKALGIIAAGLNSY